MRRQTFQESFKFQQLRQMIAGRHGAERLYVMAGRDVVSLKSLQICGEFRRGTPSAARP